MYEHGLGEGRRCPQSPHAAKHSDQNKDALRFSLIQRHTRRSRPLKHALENGRKSGALEKRESTGPSSARARFAILRMRRSEPRMRCGARVERGALFWEGSVLFFEWSRFLPLAALGGGFFTDFLLGSVSVYCLSPVVEPLSTRKEVSALQSCGAPRILGVGISEKTFWVVLRRSASRTQMCRLLGLLLSWSSARMHRLPFSETRVCGRSVFFVL